MFQKNHLSNGSDVELKHKLIAVGNQQQAPAPMTNRPEQAALFMSPTHLNSGLYRVKLDHGWQAFTPERNEEIAKFHDHIQKRRNLKSWGLETILKDTYRFNCKWKSVYIRELSATPWLATIAT